MKGIDIGCRWERQKESELGRQRRRWVRNIKMNFGEVGWNGMVRIRLAQDRGQWKALVNTVMNLPVQ
jgi:hypothetical protein